MIQLALQLSYPNRSSDYRGLTSERHKVPVHGLGAPWQVAAYQAVLAIAGFALDTGQITDVAEFERAAAELVAELTAHLKVVKV